MTSKIARRRVEITQEDIDSARKNTSHACMIAEAVKRAFPELKNISVDVQSIRGTLKEENKRYVWFQPKIGQINIDNWERGIEVVPFSFMLNDPAQIYPAKVGQRKQEPKIELNRSGSLTK